MDGGGSVPHGLRLNNPGNLRRSTTAYKGLKAEQTDAEFSEFETAVMGIRAISMCLQAYQHQYKLHTISALINRWAPPTENNTKAYIAFIENQTEISSDAEFDVDNFNNMLSLIKAIIHFEQGQQPYTDAQIGKAIVLSGIQPDSTQNKSRTVKGQQIVAASVTSNAALQVVKDNIDTASNALQPLADYSHYIQYGLFALTALGVGLTLWAYFDDNRKGLHP